MPRANLYIIEWQFPKHETGWSIVPMTVAQAAFAKRADADEVLDDLRRDAFRSNVRYRVRRAMFLDAGGDKKLCAPGRAARKCVRRAPPPAATRESGRSPGCGPGRPQFLPSPEGAET